MTDTIEQAARVIVANAGHGTLGMTQDESLTAARFIAQALSDAGLLAGGWMDIGDAPKDAFILARGTLDPHPDSRALYANLNKPKTAVVYWDYVDDSWCPVGATWLGPWFKPTHFMPLPSPPSSLQKAQRTPPEEGR